jgi:predicted RNA binding protein YcfA (HicA-like mRNA interferase family)
MTARQVIRRLLNEGWREVRQTGSHKQFQHENKPGTVTVPTHKGDIPAGTLSSIYRQAGWERN